MSYTKKALKLVLDPGLVIQKVHQVIKFIQEAWLKPYIHLNTGLRAKVKNDFEKDFSKMMKNLVFGKIMENVWKQRNSKLQATVVSEPNYCTTNWSLENLLPIEMKKIKKKIQVYISLSIVDISKITM